MAALYIALIIIAALMLLLLIPIDCVVDFSYNPNENRGAVVLKYAFVTFKLYPPDKTVKRAEEKIGKDAEKEKKELDVKGIIKLAKTVYTELREDIYAVIESLFKKTLRIKELNVSSRFGTGDPMYTGMAVGAANAFVYNAVGFIDRNMRLDKWNVFIDGDFDNACLSAGAYGKIRTSGLNIIILGVKAALLLLKIQKINRRIKKNG